MSEKDERILELAQLAREGVTITQVGPVRIVMDPRLPPESVFAVSARGDIVGLDRLVGAQWSFYDEVKRT